MAKRKNEKNKNNNMNNKNPKEKTENTEVLMTIEEMAHYNEHKNDRRYYDPFENDGAYADDDIDND